MISVAINCWRSERRAPRVGAGKTSDLRDVGNPQGAKLVAQEEQEAGEAVEHPGQALAAHGRIHHDQPEMQHLDRLSRQRKRQDGQGIEGDRRAVANAVDEGDDGALKHVLPLGKDAIVETAIRHGTPGHRGKVRTQPRKLPLVHPQAGIFDDPGAELGRGLEIEIEALLQDDRKQIVQGSGSGERGGGLGA
jgi:hypothetical protein